MTTIDEEPEPRRTEARATPAPEPRRHGPKSGLMITEQRLRQLAWFSLAATSSTIFVALGIVVLGVVTVLTQPEPAVFERELPELRIVADRPVPPLDLPAPSPARTPPPRPVVPVPAPAPQVPEDVEIDEPIVPGQLPDAPAAPEAPPEDTAVQAAEALQDDRVTIGIATDPPGADVRVDGRFRGRTPVKLMLNPGRYDIDLKVQSIEARWTLDASTSQRKCFSLQGSELLPIECG